MSSRKRPLAELPANIASTTPSGHAPSTPHALRALQQRSGARTRSVRTAKVAKEVVRPDSARGILRRLAKITAPATRRVTRTPIVVTGKENERPQDEEDEDEPLSKRPRMTFDIKESVEESFEEEAPAYEEEEDSELPTAPTPSVLPEDEDEAEEATNTFKAVDFPRQPVASEKIDKRKSRVSMLQDEGEDDDQTMLTERGRRAISEEATGHMSRYSFGSIRMSDFGTELEVRRESYPNSKSRISEAKSLYEGEPAAGPGILLGDDTQNLRQARQSPGEASDEVEDFFMPAIDDEDTFQLDLPDDEGGASPNHAKQIVTRPELAPNGDDSDDVEEVENAAMAADGSFLTANRPLTEIESSATRAINTRRRKRMKMTKHGTMIPSLPASLVKHIATETQVRRGRRRPKLGNDHMAALEQATEWFFEQVGEDLAAYAEHGRRRKRIDNADVLMLMQRQRLLKQDGELQRLAKDWLPKEVLDGIEIPDGH